MAVVMGHENGPCGCQPWRGAHEPGIDRPNGAALPWRWRSADSRARLSSSGMTAFGLGSAVGVMLPYSRLHESEADEMD